MFSHLFNAYLITQETAPITSEGMLAMERMVQEIRQARLEDTPPWQDQPSLLFPYTSDGKLIQFYQSATGKPGIYMDKGDTTEKLLAKNIKPNSLSFSGRKIENNAFVTLVEISFTMNNGMFLRTAVHVRPQ